MARIVLFLALCAPFFVLADHAEPMELYVVKLGDGFVLMCDAAHGPAACVVFKAVEPLSCNMDTGKCEPPKMI